MSHEATKWALRQRGLKPAAKIVLFYLCDHHNSEGGCFPSQELLAAECEISRASLNNQLNELEAMGLLRRHASVDDRTKRQRPTRYILAFEDESRVQNLDKAVSKNETRTVSKNQTEPCPKNDESRVQNLDTNPVREPLRQQTERETAPVVVAISDQTKRRDEVLRLMGLDGVIRPDGKFTGMTNDQAELPKWDELGLTRSEQDAKISEMLAKQRAKQPGFLPNRWSWFTAGMTDLAAAKQRGPSTAHPENDRDQRRAMRRKIMGA